MESQRGEAGEPHKVSEAQEISPSPQSEAKQEQGEPSIPQPEVQEDPELSDDDLDAGADIDDNDDDEEEGEEDSEHEDELKNEELFNGKQAVEAELHVVEKEQQQGEQESQPAKSEKSVQKQKTTKEGSETKNANKLSVPFDAKLDLSNPIPEFFQSDYIISSPNLTEADFKSIELQMNLYLQNCIEDASRTQERNQFIQTLASNVSQVLPHSSLTIFGSCATQLWLRQSDVDFAINYKNKGSSYSASIDGNEVRQVLKQLLRHFRKLFGHKYVLPILASRVRVPLIQITDPKSSIQADVKFLSHFDLSKTELVKRYLSLDERVRVLILAVKQWAKQVGLNDAHLNTFNSFSLVLLVIQSLQLVQPPVLPIVCEKKVLADCGELEYWKKLQEEQKAGHGNVKKGNEKQNDTSKNANKKKEQETPIGEDDEDEFGEGENEAEEAAIEEAEQEELQLGDAYARVSFYLESFLSSPSASSTPSTSLPVVFSLNPSENEKLWKSENKMTVAELLAHFFALYALRFDPSRHAVSIQKGRFVERRHGKEGIKQDASQLKTEGEKEGKAEEEEVSCLPHSNPWHIIDPFNNYDNTA